jgi:ABC-type Fe3+/spermidine/putrescine transport system ATPase subunit
MNQGIIEQIWIPVEIYRFPNSKFMVDFIGRENFVPGQVKEKNGSNLTVKALAI